jgi:hypothetical protein
VGQNVNVGVVAQCLSETHSLEIRVLALQVSVFLFKLFTISPHSEDLFPCNLCNPMNRGRVKVGATFPRFAVTTQDGVLHTQLGNFSPGLRGGRRGILNLVQVYPAQHGEHAVPQVSWDGVRIDGCYVRIIISIREQYVQVEQSLTDAVRVPTRRATMGGWVSDVGFNFCEDALVTIDMS